MNRELKLALIIGFSLVLLVTVLVSDHLSKARHADLAPVESARPLAAMDPTSQPAMSAEAPVARTAGPEPGWVSEAALPPSIEAGSASAAEMTTPSLPLVRFDQSAGRVDPDAALVETVRGLGGQVVDRGGVREVVLSPAPSAAPVTGEIRHVVASGESLFTIAKRYYGDGSAWKRIRDANPDRVSETGVVRAGVTLKIPGATPGATRGVGGGTSPESGQTRPQPTEPRVAPKPGPSSDVLASRSGAGRPATYTVRRGDTLGEIAQRMLGSARRKHELMKLNNINDENTILAGAVLRLPER